MWFSYLRSQPIVLLVRWVVSKLRMAGGYEDQAGR
jgi:hypothetical protein